MANVDEEKIEHITSTLESLEFGSLIITVHKGEITQIDTTEKKRFTLEKKNK